MSSISSPFNRNDRWDSLPIGKIRELKFHPSLKLKMVDISETAYVNKCHGEP